MIVDTERRHWDRGPEWNWWIAAASPHLWIVVRDAVDTSPTKCKETRLSTRVIGTSHAHTDSSVLIYGQPHPKLISVSYANLRWRNLLPIPVVTRHSYRNIKMPPCTPTATTTQLNEIHPCQARLSRTATRAELGSSIKNRLIRLTNSKTTVRVLHFTYAFSFYFFYFYRNTLSNVF